MKFGGKRGLGTKRLYHRKQGEKVVRETMEQKVAEVIKEIREIKRVVKSIEGKFNRMEQENKEMIKRMEFLKEESFKKVREMESIKEIMEKRAEEMREISEVMNRMSMTGEESEMEEGG